MVAPVSCLHTVLHKTIQLLASASHSEYREKAVLFLISRDVIPGSETETRQTNLVCIKQRQELRFLHQLWREKLIKREDQRGRIKCKSAILCSYIQKSYTVVIRQCYLQYSYLVKLVSISSSANDPNLSFIRIQQQEFTLQPLLFHKPIAGY